LRNLKFLSPILARSKKIVPVWFSTSCKVDLFLADGTSG
jgi:hypothetical protein